MNIAVDFHKKGENIYMGTDHQQSMDDSASTVAYLRDIRDYLACMVAVSASVFLIAVFIAIKLIGG